MVMRRGTHDELEIRLRTQIWIRRRPRVKRGSSKTHILPPRLLHSWARSADSNSSELDSEVCRLCAELHTSTMKFQLLL